MGGLRTFLLVLAGTVHSAPAMADDLPLHMFATCTGRLSALVEHQWLTDGPASELTRAERDAMAALTDAVMGPGAERLTMHWRVTAKAAQASLLSQAMFGRDPGRRIARQAEELVAECRALLLG